jgi:hypothetical protein
MLIFASSKLGGPFAFERLDADDRHVDRNTFIGR